jgi:hypothetical protein
LDPSRLLVNVFNVKPVAEARAGKRLEQLPGAPERGIGDF